MIPLFVRFPVRHLVVIGVVLLWAAAPVSAESLRSRLTRKDDMNAVRFNGQAWTIHDLLDFRSRAPGRFDANNQRLGSALSLGLDGLEARRTLNSQRFDFYHPFLGYLLSDSGTAPGGQEGVGNLGDPVDPPPLQVGPDGTPELPPSGDPSPRPPTPPQPPIVPSAVPPPSIPPVTDPTPVDPPPLTDNPIPGGGSSPSLPGPSDGPILPSPGIVPPGPEGPPDPTSIQAIPEPPGMLQLVIGLLGLGGILAWRRRVARPQSAF